MTREMILTIGRYDNCYNNGENGTPLNSFRWYKVMSDALLVTVRPILYSLCQVRRSQRALS